MSADVSGETEAWFVVMVIAGKTYAAPGDPPPWRVRGMDTTRYAIVNRHYAPTANDAMRIAAEGVDDPIAEFMVGHITSIEKYVPQDATKEAP
jgi:hypothetical protein